MLPHITVSLHSDLQLQFMPRDLALPGVSFLHVLLKRDEFPNFPQHAIRRAQVKVGLINLCKGLFSLNARIYYKLKSGT